MAVRVNTVSIGASATSAGAYSAAVPADGSMGGAGTAGIIAGDVIVVSAMSNGTHVLNGITCQDSVNLTNFTQITEQRLGSSSNWYQQTFYYVAAANVPAGSNITLTPYAAATDTNFSVDVFRFALGTVTNAVVSQANTANTSQAAPALAANPLIGNLVLTFDAAAGTGTLTQGAAFTAGSTTTGTATRTANAYTSASGSSTYGSTWTDSGSVVSATQTVALQNAGVGTPYLVGNKAQAAIGTTGPFTNVVSVGSGGGTSSNANDALFVLIGAGGGGTTAPTGVADTKSHTYTQIASLTAANGMCAWVYQSLHAVTPITVGGSDTVTATFNNGTYATFVEVIACAGINQTTALDLTATGNASGSAPTATTATNLTNNNELALAVITSGSATQGVTWSAGITAMDAGLHVTGGVYMSVGTKVISGSTAPVTMGGTLGASGVWADLLVTLLPDPPAGAPATITITNTSPLTAGQVGVAYSNQLNATGGSPPYKWDLSAGALPGGLILEPGGGSGSSGDFTYVGANTGPGSWSGTGPTLAQLNSTKGVIGPIGCYKYFYSAGGSGIYTGNLGGNAAGGSWATNDPGDSTGFCPKNITDSIPGCFVYVSWGVKMTTSAIAAFVKSIPTGIAEVGFCFQSEAEMAYPMTAAGGAQFVADWTDQANKIRSAQSLTATKLTLILGAGMQHYQDGTLTNSWFIPPANVVDVYGLDFYDRFSFWAGSDMSTTKGWAVWMPMVKGLGKPLALTEFGISGAAKGMTAAQQNTRLQADHAYLKGAFGPGGTVSQLPLYTWLNWQTDGTATNQTNNINQFLGVAAQSTWAGIAATQSGSGGTGTGGGGLIVGTPTTTAGSPFSFTARATDTANATGTKAFSLTINSSSALAITTTSPLPGGTVGVAYSNLFTASGGTAPYTWSLQSGTWPAGLSISGQLLTGTPTTPGTSTPVLKVQDNVAATATLAVSITISATVSVTTTTLPSATVGSPYSATLAATGGTTPYTWATVSGVLLPDGLAFDPVAGTISGTPTTPGAPTLQFQVTDAAGATALSPQMPLSVAPVATGGLPAIGRRRFGGGELDLTFTFSGSNWVKAGGVVLTFYTALVGGSQITDLQTTGGGAITSVTTDSNGFIGEFFGPAGTWKMAADANAGAGPRAWIVANDSGDEITTLWTFLKPLSG